MYIQCIWTFYYIGDRCARPVGARRVKPEIKKCLEGLWKPGMRAISSVGKSVLVTRFLGPSAKSREKNRP